MLVSPSTGDLALLSVTANLGSLTFGLRGSVKQPPSSSNCTYTIYTHIVAYMHFFLESHGFHYLLKFVKRLKTTPLFPLATNFTHIHRQPLLTSRWLPMLFQWPRIFSKPSSNCLLHICLRMLHKHLQLIICPQPLNVLLLYSPHQPLSRPENPRAILKSFLFLFPIPHPSSPSLLHCPNLGLHQFSAAVSS